MSMLNRGHAFAVLTLAICLCGSAFADGEAAPDDGRVAAGATWILDSNNWQQGEDMLPDPVLKRVKNGDYWYRVQPIHPDRIRSNYSPHFWAASEANAGKYDLTEDLCGLKDVSTGKIPDFYFGLPFPKIDPNDPDAGCKIAWNFSAAGSQAGGGGATFTLNGIDSGGEFKRIKLWTHLKAFIGMHGGPIDNPENLRGTGITNVLEPTDIDGVGGLSKRVNDWDAQDKSWFYVPATRRVRRTSAASRSEPVAGMDIFADDLNCYGGKDRVLQVETGTGEQARSSPRCYRHQADGPMKKVGDTRWSTSTIPYFKGSLRDSGGQGRFHGSIVENFEDGSATGLDPRRSESEDPVLQLR